MGRSSGGRGKSYSARAAELNKNIQITRETSEQMIKEAQTQLPSSIENVVKDISSFTAVTDKLKTRLGAEVRSAEQIKADNDAAREQAKGVYIRGVEQRSAEKIERSSSELRQLGALQSLGVDQSSIRSALPAVRGETRSGPKGGKEAIRQRMERQAASDKMRRDLERGFPLN